MKKPSQLLSMLLILLAIPLIPVNASHEVACWVYEVTAIGEVNYGRFAREFEIQGYIGVTSESLEYSQNSHDLIAIFGFPVTNPLTGSLAFASNGYYIGSLSRVYRSGTLDLAEVTTGITEDGNSVWYQAEIPQDSVSNFGINQGVMANVLNWGSGITAGAKLVVAGYIYAEFDADGNVTGIIELGARDWTSYQTDILYYAEIEGQIYGTDETIEGCVIASR